MKLDIHPKYHQTKVECACGAVFEVGSTKDKIKVEICSNCHPFYTGKEKLVDAAGRVEKFKARARLAESKLAAKRKIATSRKNESRHTKKIK